MDDAGRQGENLPAAIDTAGVIAPPPLLFAGFLCFGLIADHLIDGPGSGVSATPRFVAGTILSVVAVILLAAAVRGFRSAGTKPEPWKPTTALVVEGIYRVTRNPMYLAMMLVYLAVALMADSLVTLALALPLWAIVRFGVIGREERYLDRLFGEPYRAYRSRVRRWI